MLQYVYGLIVDQEALQKNSFFSGFFFLTCKTTGHLSRKQVRVEDAACSKFPCTCHVKLRANMKQRI